MTISKIYNGTSWVPGILKAYNGSAWVAKPNFYNGTVFDPLYGDPPLVSALANGQTNSSFLINPVYAGVKFDTNGEEYERTAAGGYGASVGTWLDQGTSAQVWVEFLRTSGTKTQFVGKSNSTRYQADTNSIWYISDNTAGASYENIYGRFRFWDAASGGNQLQLTGFGDWRCRRAVDPCPTCCFTPDTLVLMVSGIELPIGELEEGDIIHTANGPEPITEIITRTDRAMFRLTFEDGRTIDTSDDHPFDVNGKPKSLNNYDIEYKDLGLPEQLEVGDSVTLQAGGSTRVMLIESIDYPGTVYTFENSEFFANGLLVY